MPRKEQPITENTPVAELASQLREVREEARITYREMAEVVNYSHVQLGRAARGDRLPSWQLTKAYLKACGVTEKDRLQKWEQYWNAVDLVAGRGAGRLKRKRELHRVTSVPEFGEYLQSMANRGRPQSLRQLGAATGIGKSTIADWFRGITLPTAGHVYQYAQMLGASELEVDELLEVRDRLESEGNGSSELARTLAAIRSSNGGGPLTEAAHQVSAALAEAEKRRLVRVEPRKRGQVRTSGKFEKKAGTARKRTTATWVAYNEQKLVASDLAQAIAPQQPARHVAGALEVRARDAAREAAARRLDVLQEEAADAVEAARASTAATVEDYRQAIADQADASARAGAVEAVAAARARSAQAAEDYRRALAAQIAADAQADRAADAVVPVVPVDHAELSPFGEPLEMNDPVTTID
jgi:transcriptional regulator with XRE-family HTH domain